MLVSRFADHAHPDRQATVLSIESQGKSTTDYNFGVVVRAEDQLIGSASLFGMSPINHTAELGICIGDTEYQNKGYGSEAVVLVVRFGFDELGLNRIGLCVWARNERGIRAYEKAGFIREGTNRQAIFRHGRYEDLHQYALLREDWPAGVAS